MFNEAFAGTLPLQGTDVAVRWDSLYNFLLFLVVFSDPIRFRTIC